MHVFLLSLLPILSSSENSAGPKLVIVSSYCFPTHWLRWFFTILLWSLHACWTHCSYNIQFTIDLCENEVPHFLDLEMSPDGILIYCKDFNTALYVNFKVNCKNDQPVVFKILYVFKMVFFCNTKNRTPIINQSFVVYKFMRLGCGASYMGKTERMLYERCVEHTWSD